MELRSQKPEFSGAPIGNTSAQNLEQRQMEPGASAGPAPRPASLAVVDPNGHRTRVEIEPLPFLIGRQPGSHLIIRDTRASRSHARIVAENGEYVIEDCGSRHGTYVNGQRIVRRTLEDSDRIEFGANDSYTLIFSLDGSHLKRMLEKIEGGDASTTAAGLGGGMGRLRAILDLARTLQGALPVADVLAQVVDTALAITSAERGFLLLRSGDNLETRVARDCAGRALSESDLRIPRDVIHRALQQRRELLSMNFDPLGGASALPQNTIADLELRSVVCVPLVRIRTGQDDTTVLLTSGSETVGLLYMDSTATAANLAGGNRELLQALAIEASTVLENARLLEEERAKRAMEKELQLARSIQRSLLPRELPAEGWFRAAGSSVASYEVGGDYFDVLRVNQHCWSAVVVDVSGKGVGSALLASMLQGALMAASDHSSVMGARMARLNDFLNERTGGEKYATVFYCLLEADGKLSYVNAAHCPPMAVRPSGEYTFLEATGGPVGLLVPAEFPVAEWQVYSGDKIVIYTDGVTEAQNTRGEFLGRKRLRDVVLAHAAASSTRIHEEIQAAVTEFTEGAPQSDDITVVVLEYESSPNPVR
jgi:phosphoserine phosphatase RsbU/P